MPGFRSNPCAPNCGKAVSAADLCSTGFGIMPSKVDGAAAIGRDAESLAATGGGAGAVGLLKLLMIRLTSNGTGVGAF